MVDRRNLNVVGNVFDPFGGDDVPSRQVDDGPSMAALAERRYAPATPRGIVPVNRVEVLPDHTTRFANYHITRTGLKRDLPSSKADWLAMGEYLFATEGAIQWCIGDWLVEGETEWGHTIPAVADALGREVQTLYNWASVVRKFDSSRRREKLFFGHHEAVAALPEVEQERWLSQAIADPENIWSVSRLRKEIQPKRTTLSRVAKLVKQFAGQRRGYRKAPVDELRGMAQALREEAQLIDAEIERRKK
jgi:hypothetical protein